MKMSKKKLTVSDIFPEKGIFEQLLEEFPELGKYVGEFFIADLDFVSKFSSRVVKGFTQRIYERYGIFEDEIYKGLSLEGQQLLAKYIISYNEYKWTTLISLINKAYEPLQPFNIELTEDGSNTLITKKDSSVTENKTDIYGFNSVEGTSSDSDKTETNREYERENPYDRHYTRIGNIGNTSFQDLVKQERAVADYKLKEIIFMDIANTICRGEYLL